MSITVGEGESALLPGRILQFEVTEVKNSVDVDVEVQDQDPRVTVADSFRFRAHFLSLEHADEIQFSEVGVSEDFAPDDEVIEVTLAGEDAENESWTLRVVNPLQLGDDYSVKEVTPVTEPVAIEEVYEIAKKIVTTSTQTGVVQTTTIYMLGTETVSLLNGDTETTVFEDVESETLRAEVRQFLSASPLSSEIRTLVATIHEEDYRLLNDDEMGIDRGVTRFLRITRLLPGAENGRVVLRFDYSLDDSSSEGFFYRTIDINTGLVAELRVEVTPDRVVVPRGGTANVTLVVGNLKSDENPAGSITFNADADVTVVAVDDAVLDSFNRRFEQTLQVTVAEDAAKPSYDVVVEVSLRGGRDFKFTVDVNDPPEYEGDDRLMVYESHVSDMKPGSKRFPLRIVDPDGGLQTLDASELMLEVVDFGVVRSLTGTDYIDNDYFTLSWGVVEHGGSTNSNGNSNSNSNSLAVALTLVGKLAMPYGSVVELRLYGVTDGYDDFEQRLLVRVEDVAPTLQLSSETAMLRLGEEATIEFGDFSDGSSIEGSYLPTVVITKVPDDLVVRYDEDAGAVTLLRLNTEGSGDVELVALDNSGGRTVVTITVERPALLPEIVPPNPLLIAAGGETRTLQARLAEDTELDVLWDALSVPGIAVETRSLAGGHAELSLTALDSAREGEHQLTLIATDSFYTRTATLFVVVVAAAAKPRLKLSLLAPAASGEESATIATLSPTLTFNPILQADLEGMLPPLETLVANDADSVATLSFQITIERRRLGETPLTETMAAMVQVGESDTGFSLVAPIGEQLAILAPEDGDVVSLSIDHLLESSPSSLLIVGDALSLPVLGRAIFDRDNDGLDDSIEQDASNPDPGVLGPATASITAGFAGGTDGGGNEVSLSLGNDARSLALAECDGVSLSLTLTLKVDGSAGIELTGCGDELVPGASLAERLNLAASEFGEGEYQLFDLLATFDSGLADPDKFLLISLPLPPAEPQTAYRVYRFDGTEWVPVIDAGLSSGSGSGAIGPSVQGATGNGEDGESFSFYAFDFNRDGSVPLLLLVESVPEEAPSIQVASMYRDRLIDIEAGMSETIPLVVPLDGLVASFTAEVTGGNVSAEIIQITTTTVAGVEVVPAVKLTGLKRTKNGAEEVVIVAYDENGEAVATTTIYVAVGNQAPEIRFRPLLANGELGEVITTTIELKPNTKTVLIAEIDDPDDDDSFVLELTGGGGIGGIAELVPRLGLSDGEPQVTNRLILTSEGARPSFKVTLTATDQSDLSSSSVDLEVCVLNESGMCPVDRSGGGGGGSGGGGGGSGLLWLFLAAPALLARLRRRWTARASARVAAVRHLSPGAAGRRRSFSPLL